MKIYSWNAQKISINDNGKIKTISPFFLVSDDKAQFFSSSNYTDLGNIFNVEELQNISSNVEMVVADIKDIIAEKTNSLINMQEKLDNSLMQLENMLLKMQDLDNLKNQYMKMVNKIEEYHNKIQEETNNYLNKLSEFKNDTDNKIKEAEFSFNKSKVNIADIMEQAENKIAAKYMATRLNMDNLYNKHINIITCKTDECKKYAEISKKWACNPINIPVENNEYSAFHYAMLNKEKGM